MAVHRCVLAARSSTFAGKWLWNIKFYFLFFIAVISGNINRLDTSTRSQLETLTDKDRLVISIDKTEPEIMKQVVIFMYTAKCEITDHNGIYLFNNLI
jgi:hypothetical protein